MAVKVAEKCVHQFVATDKKGRLEIETFSLNKRGKPQREDITTTIFKCKKCGTKQEFPDIWEKNFRLVPKRPVSVLKAAPGGKKVSSA